VAGFSIFLALFGIFLGWQYYWKGRGPHGLTERNTWAARGYAFLVNKYYFDHLYTDIIAGGTKGPIAKGANWFNQNVLDGIVNGTAVVARAVAGWLYRNIDQGAIDGTVNGSGAGAEGAGQLLRRIQTGRVQQYAALLFAATAVLAGVFIIVI